MLSSKDASTTALTVGSARTGSSSAQEHIPARDKYSIVVSFRAAYDYLYSEVEQWEKQPEFTYAILSLLMNEALDYSEDWTLMSGVVDASDQIESLDPSITRERALNICRSASDVIIRTILQHIPDYGSVRYKNKCRYYMRNEHDAIIEFDTSVFAR